MRMETLKAPTTEVFVEGHGVHVTVNPWHNLEGANVMMHSEADKGLALRVAFAATWEEIDVLLTALTVARSA